MKYSLFLSSSVRTGCEFCTMGLLFTIFFLFPLNAVATPSVVVSLKPLHSLVAAVMDGVGVPTLIVQGTGSGHGYQLLPDDAKKLADADIVFWIGPQMETFLVKSLKNLPVSTEVIALADVRGMCLLDMRTGGNFEMHHHVHHADGHHAYSSGESDDSHYKDLHFWLDPKNAEVIIHMIAHVLAKRDPASAQRYSDNAKNYGKRLHNLIKDIDHDLTPFRGQSFIVFHDAYQYFEKRFGMSAVAAITVSPEQVPGVKRISQIRDTVKKLGPVCVFSEPQFESRLIKTVIEGTGARTGRLDPLGVAIPAGPDQYLTLIRNLADSLKDCLGSQ
ncbi:MAG: zinc transport system substrate-binding protein [Candidatus Tokpelaia sp. JSC085]|nr:MAG: zinc transport system substrate-binding protein [Candidatus Tokpelaia sp. JSC085]